MASIDPLPKASSSYVLMFAYEDKAGISHFLVTLMTTVASDNIYQETELVCEG